MAVSPGEQTIGPGEPTGSLGEPTISPDDLSADLQNRCFLFWSWSAVGVLLVSDPSELDVFMTISCGCSPGRLYQTHPRRGKNLLHNLQPGSSQQPFSSCTSTLPPPLIKATSSALPDNYRDYQNCTMVQSHLPHSGYGTYMTLAPKTLIFPIFVQVRTIELVSLGSVTLLDSNGTSVLVSASGPLQLR